MNTLTRSLSPVTVIHQPDLLSYLGFFHRLLQADLFIVLDTVQFNSGGSRTCWHNRDKIKTPQGAQWITAAIQKCTLGTRINEVLLSTSSDWRQRNLNVIHENYCRAPFYEEIIPWLENIFRYQCRRLVDFNLHALEMMLQLLGIQVKSVLASTLGVGGKGNELLVSLLKTVGASTYLSGPGAADYFDPDPFAREHICVLWQDFRHPEYPQLHGAFISGLSCIDLLLNCGTARSQAILKANLYQRGYSDHQCYH